MCFNQKGNISTLNGSAASNIEQVMEAAPHKAVAVPATYHP